TNCPCKFGSKIIVNNLVRWDRWGFHLITGQQTDDSSTWKECYICSAANRSPTTGKTSLFVWMVTSSPFRVKSAMKTRCSSL
ncbi:DUF4942 domain-containing protein, partial [Escherichia coli]